MHPKGNWKEFSLLLLYIVNKFVKKGLTKFSMTGVRTFPDSDNFFLYLENIQVLQLSDTNCSDRSLDIISDNCSQLKSLNVSGCIKVTDAGLTLLCKKRPPLENLNVEYTSVTCKSVALALKNIPTLTELWYNNVPAAIREAVGLNDFSKIKVNQSFNLNNLVLLHDSRKPASQLTETLNGCIKVCPRIKNLIISELETEMQLELCSKFENLEKCRLQLAETVYPQLCINNFLELRGDKLTSLLLTSFTISIEVLAKCCPNLEELILRKPAFQAMTHSHIHFPCLKSLSLHFVQSVSNLQPASYIISSSPNLRELRLLFCIFSREIKEAVLLCPKKLKVLSISHTALTSQFLKNVLEEHTHLSTVTLRRTGISMTDFKDIVAVAERKINVKMQSTLIDEHIGDVYDVVHNCYNNVFRIRIRRRL